MDIFYECDNAKINAYYDGEINGLVLCSGSGRMNEWYIPKKIDGIDIKDIEDIDGLGGFDKVVVDDDNEYFSVIGDVLFNRDTTSLLCYPPQKREERYNVPEGVKTICGGVFDNAYLRKIALPTGLEDIVQYSMCCINLEEITIPKSLKRVFMKAFCGCENLREVYYEGSKEEWNQIDFTLFNDCLTSAHINFNCNIKERQ